MKGIYLPYWTFDAQVDAQWTAEAGHYYYTTETYTEDGRTQTRQVQHVRWEPAAGQLSHFFDDDLVCASVGVHPELLRGIEPFPTQTLKPYDPGFVAGWIVERYQIDLVGAAQASRAAMEAKVQAMCAQQVPGDTYRNLVVRTAYSRQTFKHILAPVWLMTLHVRREELPVRAERRDRRDPGRVSEEPVEDRVPRPGRHHRHHHRAFAGQRALSERRMGRRPASGSRALCRLARRRAVS